MKKRTRESNNIDITPLIDVVFLLLIFFMTSTVFKKDELSLLLSLPKSAHGEQQKAQDKTITIELNRKEINYNGLKTSFKAIHLHLEKIKTKNIPIDIRIDKNVKYDRVIKLFDQLKKYQLTNLSLITER